MDPQLTSFMPSLSSTTSNPTITATAAAVPQPTSQPETLKKRKKPTAETGFGFGSAVPSEDHPFPDRANLTLVELLTFLPLSLRCYNVVYRFITNHGSRRTIWAIVNTQRELETQWTHNSCGYWMLKAMNDAGFKGWTATSHAIYHEPHKHNWNENNLNVGGYRTPGQVSGIWERPADIPFKSLATGVRRMPTGSDALDLTRIVQYCVQKPEEPWLYPRDYDALLKLLGGPTTILEEHIDRAAFARWDKITPPPPRLAPPAPSSRLVPPAPPLRFAPPIHFTPSANPPEERKMPQQKMVKMGNTKNSRVPPEDPTHVLASSSKDAPPMPTTRSRGTMLTPAAAPKTGRPKRVRNKAVQREEQVVADPIVPEQVAVAESYIRQPAEYVAPPKGATAPAQEDIELAFIKEHDVGENDPESPYAFGGPRMRAPYRMLHKIREPHPKDASGWAENLRWAFEQSACFRNTYSPHGWNESPEHMELIVEIRKRQFWLSDELIELLEREEDREKELEMLLS